MYAWRNMTDEQRQEALRLRKARGYPMHSPPHLIGPGTFHLTAANFEHQVILGRSLHRLAAFEAELVELLGELCEHIYAHCVLPNHWHALVATPSLEDVLHLIGKLHGRSSHAWNRCDSCPGRKCWHRCTDRRMRSQRHRLATLNYIHHNPVRHACCELWQEWPFGSAASFLERIGREEATRLWQEYPLHDFGQGWDDCQAA